MVWVKDPDGVYRQYPANQANNPNRMKEVRPAQTVPLPVIPQMPVQSARPVYVPTETIQNANQMMWVKDADGVYRQYGPTMFGQREQQQASSMPPADETVDFIPNFRRFFVDDTKPVYSGGGAPLPASAPPSNAPLVKQLRGVVLVPTIDDVKKSGINEFTGVKVQGLNVIRNYSFGEEMGKYLSQPVSLASLNEMTKDIVRYYRDQGYPVVYAFVPEQDITSGVVQIVVTEGRLGKVNVTGNRWFSDSILASGIRTKPGQVIKGNSIDADIRALNSNPFRQVDAVYSPGENPGETDITLETKDRLPLRVYAGYENTGNQVTSDDRFVTGLNWGNAFFIDSLLDLQFSSDFNFDRFFGYAGSYLQQLPWRHSVNFFGSYAVAKPELPAPFNQKSDNWQVGGRYAIPLPTIRSYQQQIRVGYDFKDINNNIEFGGLQIFNTPIDVSQFVFEYNASLVDPYGITTLNPQLVFSPGGMTHNNTTADFQASRPGSRADYVYGVIGLERLTKLPWNFTLANRLRFQIADSNLVASEQFGLGGASTVRGYPERVVNTDEGILFSTEIRTPSFSLGKLINVPELQDELQFLVFLDYGHGSIYDPLPGEVDEFDLLSVGPGLRYRINTYLTVRFDYGFQLQRKNIFNNPDSSMMSLGIIASY
ncbi:ShlB/FhaC/HecB family hemolysin secretion/activation protein [Oscillatoria amoena NRMC-F 0135]|nr:ShlB/FhaC/HecB family hemolysin secretion/activation protein [Oscillatoria laete-virens]MDL5048188.1 ShlB/FhaC/HecB family hemolysin secretion/activation protein [Oscillatoria amoena NRMC-F 0135]MDL5053081.1 ShlB/FhaC/HecB family hemolysin secretion/activation protein [Oscillatoria laete-virens NRMC-F 0139]